MRLTQEYYAPIAVFFLAIPTLVTSLPVRVASPYDEVLSTPSPPSLPKETLPRALNWDQHSADVISSFLKREAEIVQRDPNWQQFEDGFNKGFAEVTNVTGKFLPVVAAVLKRFAVADLEQRDPINWNTVKNDAETVGKDALKVAPYALPLIMKREAEIEQRAPINWNTVKNDAETVGKDALKVAPYALPLIMKREAEIEQRAPIDWNTVKTDAENVGTQAYNYAYELAPSIAPAIKIGQAIAKAAAKREAEIEQRAPINWDTIKNDAETVGKDALKVAPYALPLVMREAEIEQRAPIDWNTIKTDTENVGKQAYNYAYELAPSVAPAIKIGEAIAKVARDLAY